MRWETNGSEDDKTHVNTMETYVSGNDRILAKIVKYISD